MSKENKLKEVNTRYECDTPEEFDESMQTAIKEYDTLVEKKDHAFVRVVVSEHWASEGVWVEAFDKFKEINSKTDTQVRFFDRDGIF